MVDDNDLAQRHAIHKHNGSSCSSWCLKTLRSYFCFSISPSFSSSSFSTWLLPNFQKLYTGTILLMWTSLRRSKNELTSTWKVRKTTLNKICELYPSNCGRLMHSSFMRTSFVISTFHPQYVLKHVQPFDTWNINSLDFKNIW